MYKTLGQKGTTHKAFLFFYFVVFLLLFVKRKRLEQAASWPPQAHAKQTCAVAYLFHTHAHTAQQLFWFSPVMAVGCLRSSLAEFKVKRPEFLYVYLAPLMGALVGVCSWHSVICCCCFLFFSVIVCLASFWTVCLYLLLLFSFFFYFTPLLPAPICLSTVFSASSVGT